MKKDIMLYKKTKDLICREYYVPKIEEKIKYLVANSVPCFVLNCKKIEQEGDLNPLPKEEATLKMIFMESTNKNYNHIFSVID